MAGEKVVEKERLPTFWRLLCAGNIFDNPLDAKRTLREIQILRHLRCERARGGADGCGRGGVVVWGARQVAFSVAALLQLRRFPAAPLLRLPSLLLTRLLRPLRRQGSQQHYRAA